MAKEFPHCDVLGIDQAPVPTPVGGIPPNCRFEMADINQGLSHLHGRCDFVFARLIGMGFQDFRKSLAEMQACASPGGLVVCMDADYDFYSGWPMAWGPFWTPSTPEGSYTVRVVYGQSTEE